MGLNILTWVKAKKYTDNAVSQSAALHREIVTSLPITGDEHVIYMVPVTGSGDDNYNEYMWINGAYELIGNTRVDLTDYYNKTQVDAALSGKANTSDIPTTLASLSDDSTHRLVTDTEKNTWNGKADTSAIPTLLSQLSEDATHRLVTDTEKSTWNNSSDPIEIRKLTIDVPAVSAGRNIIVHKAFRVISGYKAVGIIGIDCLSDISTLSLNGFYIADTEVYVSYNNRTSSATTSSYVMVDILYMKE